MVTSQSLLTMSLDSMKSVFPATCSVCCAAVFARTHASTALNCSVSLCSQPAPTSWQQFALHPFYNITWLEAQSVWLCNAGFCHLAVHIYRSPGLGGSLLTREWRSRRSVAYLSVHELKGVVVFVSLKAQTNEAAINVCGHKAFNSMGRISRNVTAGFYSEDYV